MLSQSGLGGQAGRSGHFDRLEGSLKKKNSKGQWKDRACFLTDETFTTYKPSKKGPPKELKECLDVKLMECARMDGDVMELRLINGEILLFRGSSTPIVATAANTMTTSNIDEWRRALTNRIDWALSKVSSAVADADKVHISGWLLKKSHNKYQLQMQERFVKVQGSSLFYYKKEGEKESGVVSLKTAEFVRPYDRSADCKVFEIFDDGRLYSFQTETSAEMKRWIDVMSSVREGSRGLAEAEAKAKLLASTPLRIRIFDNDGISAFQQYIASQLKELYPVDVASENSSNEMDEGQQEENDETRDHVVWSLSKHLQAARAVNAYLDEFVPEIRREKQPRYDILTVFLVEVNAILASRLVSVLQPTSPQVVHGTLLDLHSMIDWITKYQQTLKRCYCPASAVAAVASALPVGANPNNNPIFETLSGLCFRYVNGSGSFGGAGDDGAATHLVDHCLKVWQRLTVNPSSMLQRHLDGSFYTSSPTAMWEALHQHLLLATATQSPVLHVMIADKIAVALQHIIDVIEDYVTNVDFNAHGAELKEIELELLCALANDNALHLEEVIAAVESFEMDEIRTRIDELFDPVTMRLVRCGQACLRRLSSLIYIDVEPQIKLVFTEEWLEGAQLQVVTATLTDYMNDLQQYLMPFWTEKFIFILLEHVILHYTRAVIISGFDGSDHHDHADGSAVKLGSSPVATTGKAISFLKGLGTMFKDKAMGAASAVSGSHNNGNNSKIIYCRADSESLGRLAQDVNVLNAFFSQRAGQETATEFLGIINEASMMLFMEPEELQVHVLSNIAVFPASAQAIYDMAMHCIRLRDDLDRGEKDELRASFQPALSAAPQAAEENNALGVAEGRLGLLFADLIALCETANQQSKLSSQQQSATAGSLAQKLKDMANIPLAALKKAILDDEEGEEGDGQGYEDESGGGVGPTEAVVTAASPNHITAEKAAVLLKRRQSVITKTTAGLVDEVLEVMMQQDEEMEAILQQQDLQQQQVEARRRKSPGMVSLEGHLDKKSPAHNLWQSRWFRILTRENPAAVDEPEEELQPYLYQLLWYKKKGGSVLKAVDCDTIDQISVQQCNRPLAWNMKLGKLSLESEVSTVDVVHCVPVTIGSQSDGGSSSSGEGLLGHSYVFVLVTGDGKENVLRASKIDKMIVWINTLTSVAALSYDANRGCLSKAAGALIAQQERSSQEEVREPADVLEDDAMNEGNEEESEDDVDVDSEPIIVSQAPFSVPPPPSSSPALPPPVSDSPKSSGVSLFAPSLAVSGSKSTDSGISVSISSSAGSFRDAQATVEEQGRRSRSTSADLDGSGYRGSAAQPRPIMKIDGDGRVITDNPVHTVSGSLPNGDEVVKNPILDATSGNRSRSNSNNGSLGLNGGGPSSAIAMCFGSVNDDAELKESDDVDAEEEDSSTNIYSSCPTPRLEATTPRVGRNNAAMTPLAAAIVAAGSEDPTGTSSPSSRSLFKRKLKVKTTQLSGNGGSPKHSPTSAAGGGLSLGLSLFRPDELQTSRVAEAEREWNKYYSDDEAQSSAIAADQPMSSSSGRGQLLRNDSIGSLSSSAPRSRRVSFADHSEIVSYEHEAEDTSSSSLEQQPLPAIEEEVGLPQSGESSPNKTQESGAETDSSTGTSLMILASLSTSLSESSVVSVDIRRNSVTDAQVSGARQSLSVDKALVVSTAPQAAPQQVTSTTSSVDVKTQDRKRMQSFEMGEDDDLKRSSDRTALIADKKKSSCCCTLS